MARTDPAVSSARPSARTLPSNLQAEESLLGAMLLSRDAIAAAAEIVQPEHFYKPAHTHIYDAILSLYGSGEPVDPITVSDELARAGLLEIVGGPGALVALQTNAPAISNAARYSRIVEELSLLRRMIAVAGEIAELGYSMPDDVLKAIDTAEALIFNLAQNRQAGTTATIRQLLEQSLDRLEQLYERGEAITGTPTGYLDLDDLLAGLQPNALVVIGARPAMGKALALDTPLPTPGGWTTMGELQVGDHLFDDRGQPTQVTYATAVQTNRACFRITFDDGCVLVADAEHQWLAQRGAAPNSGASRLVTTQQMFDEALPWLIPCAAPLALPPAELSVDPYVLGRLVGEFVAASGDERLSRSAGAERRAGGSATALLECPTLTAENAALVSGYLRGSQQQRAAVVQGVVDAVAVGNRAGLPVELFVTEPRLAEQVHELLRSLGECPEELRQLAAGSRPGAPSTWRVAWTPGSSGYLETTPVDARRWRAIVSIEPTGSVPVRCITVDSPSHLYLAGRSMIPTHNTSFALGMAAHAALVGQRPVLFFSLEMSQVEITQRVLCSEARVDATRVRNGRLNEGDWEKISHTVGRLAEAPIWIDDNPNLTVMEIRSKARKLKSQVGDLGLVVVDYIQLMTGRSAAESRQVEVAEISRGLKILAREIETPVVALAQLNRGLEQRADKRPMLSDLRESGCLPAGSRIMRADNGHEVTIGELVLSQEQPLVWSVDENQRLVPARLLKAFPSGIKPVYRLTLSSGRSVQASANHPFLTPEGWARLDQLDFGSVVAVPARIPCPVQPSVPWSADVLANLAALLRSGWCRSSSAACTPAGNPPWEASIPEPVFGLPDEQLRLLVQLLDLEERPLTTSARLARDLQRLLARLDIATVVHTVDKELCSDGCYRERWAVRRASQRDRSAVGDLDWDRVVEVAWVGDQPTFDATIENTHNFVADGVVVHNSLEQDADVVMFLYRDEIYNRESPDQGIAEVIVAKHRSGPTGLVRLAFLGQYTKFVNMARS